MRRWQTVLFSLLLIPLHFSAAQDRQYAVSLSGSFTTSSKLFFDPNNPDDYFRSLYDEIDNIFGSGLDVRRQFGDGNLQIGLGAEYLMKREDIADPSNPGVPEQDGFWAVPLELTGYFRVPFSSETVEMFLGGGGGVYFGNRQLSEAGVTADVLSRSTQFGIHILSEVQYNFNPDLGLRFSLKFRNVQLRTTNAFTRPNGIYGATVVPLDQTPRDSRINIDGMLMSLGIVYRF